MRCPICSVDQPLAERALNAHIHIEHAKVETSELERCVCGVFGVRRHWAAVRAHGNHHFRDHLIVHATRLRLRVFT